MIKKNVYEKNNTKTEKTSVQTFVYSYSIFIL